MARKAEESHGFAVSVQRARAVLAAHGSVGDVSDVACDADSARIEATIEVPLPNRWKAVGQSPNGVRRFETVRFDFPRGFPLDPPEISLRADFSRAIAHVQPWVTKDGRPVPCIQDGVPSEFFLQQGLAGMLNQTIAWLEHSAEGNLIDSKQGWEPTRRDSLKDFVVADASALRSLVDRRGGHRFLKFKYLRFVDDRTTKWLHGEILHEPVTLSREAVKLAFHERALSQDGRSQYAESLALVVWPGKELSGKEIVCDVYTPETVVDLTSLRARANLLGCAGELSDAFSFLTRRVKEFQKVGPFSLAIVLCARRPFPLINSDSPIELCPYLIDFHSAVQLPEDDATPVRPAGHRDRIAPSLLSRMANLRSVEPRPEWSLIGAGSLGSKIALHTARAGRAPRCIVDNRNMSPHNYARHALIPRGDDMQILSMDSKAHLLSSAISGFSQNAEAITHDVANVLTSRGLARQAWPKGTWAVLNTTASLRVRAALAACQDLPGPVIECLLYAQGQLGLIAVEGRDRNPSCHDLIAEFYAACNEDAALRGILFGMEGQDLQRIATGEGCGSATMRISDARLSIYAAAMAEYLLARQGKGLPVSGEVLIGRTDEGGFGLSWTTLAVQPVTAITTEDRQRWAVRIHQRAVEKMNQEVARWPEVETGGVLIGRQDEITRTFHVVDVIDAPSDSRRSATEFILGTEGLQARLNGYCKSTNLSLICLGTWHSHLASSGPSHVDRRTAIAVGLARLTPSVLVIHTPSGLRAIAADGAGMVRAYERC